MYESLSGDKSSNRKHSSIVYVLCYILGIPLALFMTGICGLHDVVDQNAVHGLFHGTMASLFVMMPALAVHFMFEGDRSVRNMLYHIAFWVFSMALIGCIIFAWT